MKSKKISVQVKEAIIKLKTEQKSIRSLAKTSAEAKSMVWCILNKKENSGELNNFKGPGIPQKTPKMNDHRIISLVKKSRLTTSTKVRNIGEKVSIS